MLTNNKKQNKTAEPAVYYTTANLSAGNSVSIKSVIPYELVNTFKIKKGDIIFWQKTGEGRMLVWKKKRNEKIPTNAKESGKERKRTAAAAATKPAPVKAAPPKPATINTTEGSQPQINNTTTV